MPSGTSDSSFRVEDIVKGVTSTWCAHVWGITKRQAQAKLVLCPVFSHTKQGPLYALPEAAKYLSTPVAAPVDLERHLRTMRPEEMPPQLQDQFWAMQLKKQKWEEENGDLWRTEKVMDVFSDTFMTIKASCQLWAEDLERTSGLSQEQRKTLTVLVDALQNEVRSKLLAGRVGEKVEPNSASTDVPTEDLI